MSYAYRNINLLCKSCILKLGAFMKDKEFVEIEYVGKIKESGDIFDLTDEKLAKDKGIFNPQTIYGPITIVVGTKQVLAGLDTALLEMNAGDKKNIVIEPKDGFGERNITLLKIVPASQFKKQNITPYQGQYITFDQGLRGRVVSVSGGRVKLDFNHPLAGKVLEYELQVTKKVDATKDKVDALVSFYLGALKSATTISIEGAEVKILIKKDTPINDAVKAKIAEDIKKYVADIKEVVFEGS